jgi:hypothetical protein
MSHTITIPISADDEMTKRYDELLSLREISLPEKIAEAMVSVMPRVFFTCSEPDDAWCRRNVVGPGEEPPEDPNDCWFTVLAEGYLAWGKGGIYDGPPTDLRSGEIVFTKIDEPEIHGGDFYTWHYKEDTP